MIQVIDKFSSEENIKVISISGMHSLSYFEVIKSCDPFQFLRYIEQAEVIFTDSFHAMAFSVQFKKKFLVGKRQSVKIDMSERINSFTKMIGMQSVVVSDISSYEKLKEEYDFDKAHKAIEYERDKSYDFLDEAIIQLLKLD